MSMTTRPEVPAGRHLVAVGQQHLGPPAGHRVAHRARLDRAQDVGVPAVDDRHAELGLPVVVADGHPEDALGPGDHLRVQRLARARAHAQRQALRCVGLGRPQRPEDGRRGGEVGDAVVGQHLPAQLGSERRVQQDAAPAGHQRAENAVVQAVGPARVGGVPEDVVGPDVQAVLDVDLEGRERVDRHVHGFRRPGRPGRKDLDDRRGAPHPGRGIARRRRSHVGQGKVARCQLTRGAPRHHDLPEPFLRQVVGGVQLVALVGVAHHDLRRARHQTQRDGRRGEGGEQGHVDGAEAPDAQQEDDEVLALAHERGYPVTATDAQLGQPPGDSLGALLELPVGDVGAGQVGLDQGEGDGVCRVPVTEQLGSAGVGRGVGGQQVGRPAGRRGGRQVGCHGRHSRRRSGQGSRPQTLLRAY